MRNLGHKEVSLMPKVAYPLNNRASILAFQVVLVVIICLPVQETREMQVRSLG